MAGNLGPPPSQRFSPFKEVGAGGVAVFGGRVMTRERGVEVFGNQRWITYSDMLANTSIVAAGVRYFLNIIAAAKWTVQPAEETGPGHLAAEFIDSVINGMDAPWRRTARSSASYRFMGFSIQEWVAKRRDKDQKIVLDTIEPRPQHTIDRWEVDERGTVLGVWQMPPQTNQPVYLPRNKLLYMVDDSLTDSPEGLGLYRHLVEPYLRLKKYLLLEGQGFERDFRGIPIGRVPYQAIRASVAAGTLTEAEGRSITAAVENFVKMQSKSEDTSLVLDSAPYVVDNDGGKSISGVMQYGLELLQGQSADFAGISNAVNRLNQEMARVIGVEHLLLGGEGGANRALSEDKSRNFYLTANGALDDICDGVNKDIVPRICDLNGIPEEMRPKINHSDISFRSVQEVTAALRDMSTAGAVLQPNDPVIEDVRDMLGLQRPPEPTAEMMGLVGDTESSGSGTRQRVKPNSAEEGADGDPTTAKPGKKPGGGKPPFGKKPAPVGKKPFPAKPGKKK